jgi:ribonuclease E
MAKRMLIDATHPEETRVAVVDGRRLEEFDVEVASKKILKGNIYLAKITRVEPSLQAAFVEYGGNRHGFLAFSEIHPDYYRIPLEDREALLAEQAALAREQDAEEEEEAPRRGRRGGRRRQPEASTGEAGETTPSARPESDLPESDLTESDLPESDLPESDLTESGAPEDGEMETDGEHGSEVEAAGAEPTSDADRPETGEVEASAEPAPAAGEDAGADQAPGFDNEAAPGAETAAEATEGSGARQGGEPAALRVGGEWQNRLSSEPFEAAAAATAGGETAESDSAEAEVEPAGAGTAGAVDEAPHHQPVIEEAPAVSQPLETIGGDESEESSQRRPRAMSRRYKIQDVIKRRQILLVQVTKEERGNKGAALTTYLSLAGRYCVLMPNTDRGGGVSRKITNAGDRKRLKSIIDDLELPAGMAVIVRTAGSERSKPEVKRDFEYLIRLWDEIRELTLRSTAPALIYEEANLIKRAIRDLYTRDIEDIQVEGDEAYRAAKSFMRMLMPSHAKRVQQYKDPTMPLFTRYQIESQLDAIHNPVVQLKSGGYIVINQTEALVAIDVNSGRATRERNIEETALKTNLEASDEIARQLRLRDLAGLIVIDFIDMDESRHNGQVERRLKEAMRNDRARIQLGRISPFGLLELSRQRLRPSLFEASTEVCRFCRGTGHVRSTESTALHVLRSIEEEGSRQKSAAITVSVPGQVALFILNHKRQALAELEARQAFRIYLAADESLVPPEFRIERLKALAPGDAPPAPVVQPSAPAEAPEPEEPTIAEEGEEEIGESAPEREERGEARDIEDRGGENRGGERRSGEARDGEGRDGERRRGRRRRRRGRDRDHDRAGERPDDRQRQGDARHHGDQPRPVQAEAGLAAGPDDEGLELDTTTDGGEPGAAPSQGAQDAGEQNRRRRRRGRRGGRRRRRDGERGGETATQGTPYAPAAGQAEADGNGGFETAGHETMVDDGEEDSDFVPAPRSPAEFESPLTTRYEPLEPAPLPPAQAPISSRSEPASPQPAKPARPAAEPAAASEAATQQSAPSDAEEAKSGPRKRGWWQRVLS